MPNPPGPTRRPSNGESTGAVTVAIGTTSHSSPVTQKVAQYVLGNCWLASLDRGKCSPRALPQKGGTKFRRARDMEVCTGVRVSIGGGGGSPEAGRRLCVSCGRFTSGSDFGWTFALGGRSGGFRSPAGSTGCGDVPLVRLQFARRGTSAGRAMRGRNRIKRFRAGIGRSQC
jgi:hypothetical protein